ncbi:RAMP superfamily CRISPR-associated protein [Sulfuricystis multivorans]|uniref:RAMP superfamily CRISPR-associated protein n=1 Tax=Sulfuricystis multivorans TaxID=2211108 RepID=UPI000F8234DC|nr:RAMP superfamily CRISPR-associated protein [Sulfuricystis multivorans]
MMKTETFTLRFNTPAFLGDAKQNGRWRTPPIKHELRHWWRVAYAADHGYRVSIADLRREEGLLFGNAWLENDFRKSMVRIRLERWDSGKLKSWQGLEQATVTHPETQKTAYKVGPHAYLGYGPLDGRGNTKLSKKVHAALQADEQAQIAFAYPTTHAEPELERLLETNVPRIERSLHLMHRFGTLGGRSRNGWGSYELLPSSGERGAGDEGLPLRLWRDCLELDWPHAIGKDEKGALIWETAPHDDWKALMRTLAIVKIGLRTQFRFEDKQLDDKRDNPNGIEHGKPQDRHWLAYPVTHHAVKPWDKERRGNETFSLNLRLPNQMRFKVRRTEDGKLKGVIFHMPHLPPLAFGPDRAAIERLWKCVHQFLDALTQTPAQRSYCANADREALAKQKAQLDGVKLSRSKA